MPAFRMLIIAFAVIAALFIARQLFSSRKKISQTTKGGQDSSKVVACEVCGVHVPDVELTMHNGRRICTQCAAKNKE